MTAANRSSAGLSLLAESWNAAAVGYDDIFVRLFAPWTGTCIEALQQRAKAMVSGTAWDACCGPGHELSLLHAVFESSQPDGEEKCPRHLFASDLSPGMVRLATNKAARIGRHIKVEVGDAMHPPGNDFALIFSIFGLQQLPDPVVALSRWVWLQQAGGRTGVGVGG